MYFMLKSCGPSLELLFFLSIPCPLSPHEAHVTCHFHGVARRQFFLLRQCVQVVALSSFCFPPIYHLYLAALISNRLSLSIPRPPLCSAFSLFPNLLLQPLSHHPKKLLHFAVSSYTAPLRFHISVLLVATSFCDIWPISFIPPTFSHQGSPYHQ